MVINRSIPISIVQCKYKKILMGFSTSYPVYEQKKKISTDILICYLFLMPTVQDY